VDKTEVEVLKRARESFFVRRDRVLTGREAPELPVERAFRCRKPERAPALAPTRLRAFIDRLKLE
jgi:hypothetical protein